MKAIIEFNLPEEKREHLAAMHGMDAFCSLWSIQQIIRNAGKHANFTDEQWEVYEQIKAAIYEEINSLDVDVENIVC